MRDRHTSLALQPQGPGAASASAAASGGGSGSPLLSSGPSSSALQQLLASAGSAGAQGPGGLSAGSSRPHSPSPSAGSPPPQGGAPGEGGGGPPSALAALRSALAERRFGCAELTNYRKDGRPFQLLLGLVPVLDGDGGSLLQWVGCQCDLDERRHRGEPADEAFAAKWQEQVGAAREQEGRGEGDVEVEVEVEGGGAGTRGLQLSCLRYSVEMVLSRRYPSVPPCKSGRGRLAVGRREARFGGPRRLECWQRFAWPHLGCGAILQ